MTGSLCIHTKDYPQAQGNRYNEARNTGNCSQTEREVRRAWLSFQKENSSAWAHRAKSDTNTEQEKHTSEKMGTHIRIHVTPEKQLSQEITASSTYSLNIYIDKNLIKVNNIAIQFKKLEKELLKIKANTNNQKKGSTKKSKASSLEKIISQINHKTAYQKNKSTNT